MPPNVIAVCSSSVHDVVKDPKISVNLIANLGVQGDVHLGQTTQHLYLQKKDPARSNLTQVHLLHAELHDVLNDAGFALSPGMMGVNITTRGVDLMTLPCGARLHLGEAAVVEVTGLRMPCHKLNRVKTRHNES